MTFDWTTFILEILNFLILLWILQRLIYKPVLTLLDARQRRIQTQIDEAERLRAEAEALKVLYQDRLAAWQQERETACHALDDELSQRRTAALNELQYLKSDEEAKARARNQAFASAEHVVLLREATRRAYAQSAAMLERLATPALTHAIVEACLQDLHDLDETQRTSLCQAANHSMAEKTATLISAHPLTTQQVTALTTALCSVTGNALSLALHEDDSLIAGLRIVIGEYELDANLADELAFFQTHTTYD